MPHAADKSGEDKDAASDEVDVTPSQSAAVCAALASAITWKLISEGQAHLLSLTFPFLYLPSHQEQP